MTSFWSQNIVFSMSEATPPEADAPHDIDLALPLNSEARFAVFGGEDHMIMQAGMCGRHGFGRLSPLSPLPGCGLF